MSDRHAATNRLDQALALAARRAARDRAPMRVYEARRWRLRGRIRGRGRDYLEPVFYVRSEFEGPPPREDRVPDPEVVGPPFSGPLLVRVVQPPTLG